MLLCVCTPHRVARVINETNIVATRMLRRNDTKQKVATTRSFPLGIHLSNVATLAMLNYIDELPEVS